MILDRIGLKSRNLNLLFASMFFGGILFFLPVVAIYMERELTTLQSVALVFSIRAIATVIFEVPTGAISDLFGRVNTIRLSYATYILGMIFLWMGGPLYNFIIFALLWAVAISLESGTDTAYLYDTLKDEGREGEFKKLNGLYRVMWTVGATIGSVFGGYMAAVSLRLPLLLTFIPLLVSFVLIWLLKEPSYEKEDHRNVLKHMIESSKVALKSRNILVLIVVGFFLVGFSETTHIMNAIFFDFKGISIVHFGYITAVIFALSSTGFYLSDRVSAKFGDKRTLIVSVLVASISILLATYFTGFLSVLFIIIPAVFFGLRWPIIDDIVNREVASSKRATVMSLMNFSRQLGVAVFAPYLGYLADLYTINTAFRLSGGVMLCVTLLFLFLRVREG